MPARTLPPAMRRHPELLAAAAATAAVVIALAATVGAGSGAAAAPPGPTATVSARELATTLETTGVVERIKERTISYAGDRAVSAAAGTAAAAPAAADTVAGGLATTATPPTTATAPAEADEAEDPVILTTVAAAGSEVGRNTVLYSADDEPVVALIGTVPAWRAFETDMDGGADVRQLEENLTELGYGAGLSVDDEFTAATAAAVKRWEAAGGRADPDGVVDAGDVVFLAEPGRVLGLDAAVGDPLEAGTPVLVVGTRQQVVTGTVAVTASAAWGPGTEVALEWSDGTATAGTVSSTGTEVTDGQVALVVALSDADSLRPTGAQVAVSTVGHRADGAVSVPVAAVFAGPGGKAAVRQAVAGEKADRVVQVTTGIVAGGWVEIRSGLDAGDDVRLPG